MIATIMNVHSVHAAFHDDDLSSIKERVEEILSKIGFGYGDSVKIWDDDGKFLGRFDQDDGWGMVGEKTTEVPLDSVRHLMPPDVVADAEEFSDDFHSIIEMFEDGRFHVLNETSQGSAVSWRSWDVSKFELKRDDDEPGVLW